MCFVHSLIESGVMQRTFRIGDREVEFVPEEPGVILILLIIFTFLLVMPSGNNSGDQSDMEEVPAAASHQQ
jgi:hypothetical protein